MTEQESEVIRDAVNDLRAMNRGDWCGAEGVDAIVGALAELLGGVPLCDCAGCDACGAHCASGCSSGAGEACSA